MRWAEATRESASRKITLSTKTRMPAIATYPKKAAQKTVAASPSGHRMLSASAGRGGMTRVRGALTACNRPLLGCGVRGDRRIVGCRASGRRPDLEDVDQHRERVAHRPDATPRDGSPRDRHLDHGGAHSPAG